MVKKKGDDKTAQGSGSGSGSAPGEPSGVGKYEDLSFFSFFFASYTGIQPSSIVLFPCCCCCCCYPRVVVINPLSQTVEDEDMDMEVDEESQEHAQSV